MPPSKNLILFVCFLKILACALFLIGFFPIKPPVGSISTVKDLPTSVGDNRLNEKLLYRRHYSKVVLIVIDALRVDFITEGDRMPFLKEQLSGRQSCLLSAKVDVPTVTLPRIKAIVTGAVPTYLDIMSNLGSSGVMSDDNIIDQASQHGYNIVFYGDDTWLRLYPKGFKRFEGTSSFFVNDFYDVDNNVTRNLRRELLRSDWDMMILHFLGLDHIGHVEGPYSSSIPTKLAEMDDIVREIHEHLHRLKEVDGGDGLILLTGDHGMKNSGGHGGASLEEITVPVVFINSNCSSDLKDHAIQQTDLTSVLSALMGIPVPAGSCGRIIPKWLGGLSLNESLYAAYYNARRMKNHFSTASNNEIEDEFNNGVYHYSLWIKENHTENWNQAAQSFSRVQEKIAYTIEGSRDTNLLYLFTSLALLLQALILLFTDQSKCAVTWKCWNELFLLAVMSCGVLWLTHNMIGIVIVFAVYNMRILAKSSLVPEIISRADYFFCSLIILHPISFMSTSFVEEEHQFWYFTFSTLLLYIMYRDHRLVKAVFPLLFLQRFLKIVNQTGDKWAHLPDLGDWLILPENTLYLTSYYFVGLLLSLLANLKCGWQDRLISMDAFLVLVQGVISCLYNVAVERISIFYDYPKSSGVWEVRCFWIVTAIRTIVSLSQLKRSKTNSKNDPSCILSILIQLHLSIIGLLVKTHNVIFGPAMVFFSLVLCSKVKEQWQLEVLHYWMGMCFFFYMGNSNSIANIDVTVSIIGLEEFNILLAFIFIILHTYAFPILAYLLLLKEVFNRTRTGVQSSFDGYRTTYLLLNGLPLIVFMILILIQREHLFIWSVFSPKLLYLMCQTVLTVVLILASCFF